MKPLPIRIRLTVWYSVMFATAALLLSLTSWWMLRHTIDATIHQDFQERVDDVRMQLNQFALQPSPDSMQTRFDAIYHFRDDGKWLQIRDAKGAWIYRSSRMVAANVPLTLPLTLAQVPASGGETSEFQQGSRHVRTFSTSVTANGQAYSVGLGAAVNKQQALLRQFGFGLLILTPLVLLAAVMAGHYMSRKALAPVTLIALEARRITDRNLDLRLPVSPTHDEISHLSGTLNNMLARIDAGYRSVRDFTANASHELRTPLARLRTEVEVTLLRQRSSEEYVEALLHVQECAEEMTRLTDNLMMLARADANAFTMTLEPVDLWKLVFTAHDEWSAVASHLRLSLRTMKIDAEDHSMEAPIFVLGDHSSLLRLLRILLDNACKFTPAGGTIVVGVEVARGVATLSVEDTGIGIPLEAQQRVFERFYRVPGVTADQNPGAGLGLSLAAWIAEQHQTSMQLKSEPRSGSRFTLALKTAGKEALAAHTPRTYSAVGGPG